MIADPAFTARRVRWSLALLFLVGALNLFDRQIINILAQDIKAELGLSDARLGLLTGTAFALFYALLGIPLGRVADRLDRAKLITAMLAVWSLFTILCGLSAGFVSLFLCRMGVGVGESGSQPASTALVADLFPPARRTSAVSLLLVGAPVGSFLGLWLGGAIASSWGWRAAFLVAGAPGIVLALVIGLWLRDPRAPGDTDRPRFTGSLSAAVADLLRQPGFPWMIAAMIAPTFLVYASSAWLPAFFIRVHHLSTARIGAYSAIAVGLGGGLGTLASGLVCDALRPRIAHVEPKMLILLFVISIPALLLTVFARNLGVALAALGLFNICAYAWLGPTTRLVQQVAGEAHFGLGIAFTSSFASIVSLACGLPIVGKISDLLTPAEGAWALGGALALTIPAAACLGILANWRTLRRLETEA